MTCCIDTLDSLQRPLPLLASRLVRRGHDVEVLTYRPTTTFDPAARMPGVPVRRLPMTGRLRRALAVRRALDALRPDVVVAYLGGPNFYAECAGLPRRRFGLIVSEFVVPEGGAPPMQRLRLAAHRLADAVVTETEDVRRSLERAAPCLRGRIVVIRNAVDLHAFRPRGDDAPRGGAPTRVLVLAGYRPQKNPFGMLRAIEHLRRRAPDAPIVVDWYGSTYAEYGQDGLYRALREAVRAGGLGDGFRVHGAARDVARLYREASLVCLPSFYEGCSNVICEAAASGLPLLVSDVGDNRKFVLDGITGFLADPHEPESLAGAILRFHGLPAAAKLEMGRRARAHAEALFDPGRFADEYVALIERHARGRERGPAGGQRDSASCGAAGSVRNIA